MRYYEGGHQQLMIDFDFKQMKQEPEVQQNPADLSAGLQRSDRRLWVGKVSVDERLVRQGIVLLVRLH